LVASDISLVLLSRVELLLPHVDNLAALAGPFLVGGDLTVRELILGERPLKALILLQLLLASQLPVLGYILSTIEWLVVALASWSIHGSSTGEVGRFIGLVSKVLLGLGDYQRAHVPVVFLGKFLELGGPTHFLACGETLHLLPLLDLVLLVLHLQLFQVLLLFHHPFLFVLVEGLAFCLG